MLSLSRVCTMSWEMKRTLSYIQNLKMLMIIVMMMFCVPLLPQFQSIGVFCPCLKKISIKPMLNSKKGYCPNNSFLIQLVLIWIFKSFQDIKVLFLYVSIHSIITIRFQSAFSGIDSLSFWYVDHNLATQEYKWLDYFTNFFLWINLSLVIILIIC